MEIFGGIRVGELQKKLEKLFLQEKPARLIISMKGGKKYASSLAKEIDCTYSHCVRILQDMEKYGLVKFEKKGRIKHVTLTPLGEDIAHNLEGLMRVLSKV